VSSRCSSGQKLLLSHQDRDTAYGMIMQLGASISVVFIKTTLKLLPKVPGMPTIYMHMIL